MSGARAVEAGLWLVRATSSGRSQIIDPLGTVRASMANGLEGVLTGKAYMLDGGTFYSRRGWLFAPIALALTLLAAALLLYGNYRRGTDKK
jgi:apolipoprotein N-acyltransferase